MQPRAVALRDAQGEWRVLAERLSALKGWSRPCEEADDGLEWSTGWASDDTHDDELLWTFYERLERGWVPDERDTEPRRRHLERRVAEGRSEPVELEAFNVVVEDLCSRHDELAAGFEAELEESSEREIRTRIGRIDPDDPGGKLVYQAIWTAVERRRLRHQQLAPAPPARRVAAATLPRARNREVRPVSRRATRRRGDPARQADDGDPPDLAVGLTSLQEAQAALARAVLSARASLDEREFAVFVDFAAAVIAREAARVTRWEQRQ